MKNKIYFLSILFLGFIACEKENIIPNQPQIEVQVVDINDQPASGVNIGIYNASSTNFSQVAMKITDSYGKVLFDELEEIKYRIICEDRTSQDLTLDKSLKENTLTKVTLRIIE